MRMKSSDSMTCTEYGSVRGKVYSNLPRDEIQARLEPQAGIFLIVELHLLSGCDKAFNSPRYQSCAKWTLIFPITPEECPDDLDEP